MSRQRVKLLVLGSIVVLGLFFTNSAFAFCGDILQIGNSIPRWGTTSATSGSQVRISINAGYSSAFADCEGKLAVFGVLDNSNNNAEIAQASGALIKGSQQSSSQNIYEYYIDWTNNLNPGVYKVKLKSVDGDVSVSTPPSGNTLTIQADAQLCSLSDVYSLPNGGSSGDQVLLTVDALGSCSGQGVSIVVNNTTGGGSTQVFNGSQQIFSSGSNRLQWGWTLPTLTTGAGQATYRIVATLGSQTLQSNPFVVSSVLGGPRCGDGTCDANSGETNLTCPRDCPSTGSGGGGGGSPGSYTFSFVNPLQQNDLVSLIDAILTWILNISLPIAVMLIIWTGIKFMLARGNPGEVTKAKQMLLFIVIGLAIIIIGKGFITLIESILNLGAGSGGGAPGGSFPIK